MKPNHALALLTALIALLLTSGVSQAQGTREDIISTMAWSPDGSQIALGDYGGRVRIFDVATQKILFDFKDGLYAVYGLAWSPNGQMLAAIHNETGVQLWDTKKFAALRILTQSGTNLPTFSGLIWSPDSQKLLAGIADGGDFIIWDAYTGQFLERRDRGSALSEVAWNSDLTRLAAVNSFGFGIMDADNFTITSGASIPEPLGKGGDPVSIAWSPNGKVIATGSLNGMVRLWDAQRMAITLELPGSDAARQGYFEAAIHAIAFSPDNANVSSISATGTIRTWSMYDGAYIENQLPGRVSSAAWDAYGVRLAYAEDDHNRQNGPDIDDRIHIIIPTASRDSLEMLIDRCVNDETLRSHLHGLLVDNGFTNFSMMDLTPDTSANPFTEAVNALPDADIATGCRADLLALESRLRH